MYALYKEKHACAKKNEKKTNLHIQVFTNTLYVMYFMCIYIYRTYAVFV